MKFWNGTKSAEQTWTERMLALNPWARGLTITDIDDEFEAAQQKATLDRWAQGRENWNAWANGMLALRKEIQQQEKWIEGGEVRETWETLSRAVFSTHSASHTFEGEFNGRERVFCGDAVFDAASFTADAAFRNAKFFGRAAFTGTEFSGDAGFDRAQFCSDADFNGAKFLSKSFDSASFHRTEFSRDATFVDTEFSGNAWFAFAKFVGNTWFDSAAFSSDATFDGTEFSDDVTFRSAKFSGDAGFARAIFSGEATFVGVEFTSDTAFNNTRFYKPATFTRVEFSGDTTFRSAEFSSDANYDRAEFSGDTIFTSAKFCSEAVFKSAAFKGPTEFNKSHFKKGADFDSIESQAAFSLADTTFDQVPSLLGATFKGTLRLDNVVTPRFPLLGWTRDKDAPARFRELKRRAAEAKDRERELLFFAQELRTSRFHATLPPPIRRFFEWCLSFVPLRVRRFFEWCFVFVTARAAVRRFWRWCFAFGRLILGFLQWRFWLSLLYGMSSNFGRSFIRPLAFWFLLFTVSAVLYLGQHEQLREARAAHHSQSPRETVDIVEGVLGQTRLAAYIFAARDALDAYVATTREAWTNPPACVPKTESSTAEFATTNAVDEALYLALKNGLVGFDVGRSDTARRIYVACMVSPRTPQPNRPLCRAPSQSFPRYNLWPAPP